jgi:DNA-directed RNA polymerase alpha subunit
MTEYYRLLTFWRNLGLSFRVANVLAMAEIDTVERLRELGPSHVKRFPNFGTISEAEVERVIGWRSPTKQRETTEPSALERVASALERIADSLEKRSE